MKKIELATPTMNGTEMNYIKEAFDTNWIAPAGANIEGFEKDIREYISIGDAVALSSGTAAMHMALKAAGVGEGDIVFCQSLTFAATCNPIIYQNAVPVFIDSEYDTWNMDPKALEKAFEKYSPRAVIAVHLYGTPAKMDEITDICNKHNTVLIEDAAESLGSLYRNRHTGTFGEYGVISFNGNKIITASGGGMLVGKNSLDKVRFWSTQSKDPAGYYQHSELGYNYRMSNIMAGIGRGQMNTIDEYVNRKTAVYEKYCRGFKALADKNLAVMNPYEEGTSPNHWLSAVLLNEGCGVRPDDILDLMGKNLIDGRRIWKPMHMQPFYQECDYISLDKDVSKDIFERGLCLPSDIKMTDEDISRVIDTVMEAFGEK